MYPVPAQPKIYHILHADRMPSVLGAGGLWCDAEMQRRGGGGTTIGMSAIKQRRLTLPVTCHPGDAVGDYVPFYFCPRSIMLYLLHMANHPELTYRGGQGPIVHLQADLRTVVTWAESHGQRWAFSLSNAGAFYTQFRARQTELGEVNWPAVAATDFRLPEVKEGKQAEFLFRHFFPWELVERIGVSARQFEQQVAQALAGSTHRPPVVLRADWYY